ncbi:MAG TPA: tetratricopeptide repeat protein [Verrucomicrobiae bacterium]
MSVLLPRFLAVLRVVTRRRARASPTNLMTIALAAALGSVQVRAQTNALPDFGVESARAYLRALAGVISEQVGASSEGYLCLARVQDQLGEKGEAEQLARKALKSDPARSDIAVFLADILIRQDRMEEAAACLRQAVERDPKCAGGYRRLGMVLDRLGDRAGAQDAFAAAVQQAPADASAWLLRGKAFLDEGKLKEAVADLEKACQLDPALANAYYPLFQAQTRLGNQDAARTALNKFQELKKAEKRDVGILTDDQRDDKTDLRAFAAGVHRAAAAVLLREGKTATAQEHLLRAVHIAPTEPEAHELLGQTLVRQGRLAEARTNLEEVVRLRPNAATDRVNLSTLLFQLKESAPAVAELKRALELDPKQPAALHNLARYYLTSRNELPEGLALAQRLVEVDRSAVSYDLLGWACFANGKTNEAIVATAEAVRREPGNTVYSARLRRLQQLTGAKQ